MAKITTHDWNGLYSTGWGDVLVPEAFSHPAKVAPALAARIYQHMLESGYAQRGDRIVDPFGGICGFGYHAMLNGLDFTAVELEPKFVALGQQNIDLWRFRLRGLDGRGAARIIQGDSRRLAAVLGACDGVVSSPPFQESGADDKRPQGGLKDITNLHDLKLYTYGTTPGQLGAMPSGSHDAVVSSPPFGEGETRNRSAYQNGAVSDMMSRAYTQDRQGTTPGNLAHLGTGDHDAVVSRPPYVNSINANEAANDSNARAERKRRAGVSETSYHRGGPNSVQNQPQAYGENDGQMGAMKEGDFAAAVSSPPYVDAVNSNGEGPGMAGNKARRERIYSGVQSEWAAQSRKVGYGDATGNIGNDSAETFWTAARAIVEQVHQVLTPGGYAVWVTKRFVRNKEIVEFSDQWQSLCEACGFETVERVRAWVVEDRGTQMDIFGKWHDKSVKRASFFRRLYEKKYPENAIDWEDVVIVRRKS